jgi:hypothetical protein
MGGGRIRSSAVRDAAAEAAAPRRSVTVVIWELAKPRGRRRRLEGRDRRVRDDDVESGLGPSRQHSRNARSVKR